ncbi:hypothetical protein JXC34_00975 [Candidatus Woesearchaeota archaeon]|nr:hypothetical protein [Candidatus Woesearchaeota archaeon]
MDLVFMLSEPHHTGFDDNLAVVYVKGNCRIFDTSFLEERLAKYCCSYGDYNDLVLNFTDADFYLYGLVKIIRKLSESIDDKGLRVVLSHRQHSDLIKWPCMERYFGTYDLQGDKHTYIINPLALQEEREKAA